MALRQLLQSSVRRTTISLSLLLHHSGYEQVRTRRFPYLTRTTCRNAHTAGAEADTTEKVKTITS